MSFVMVASLATMGPLQANHLSLTLFSIRNLLQSMPSVLASPWDARGVLQQLKYIQPHTITLRDIQQAFIAPATLEDVRTAPPSQQMNALVLAGEIAKRAKLYNICVPGLIYQQPFSAFPAVMRSVMRDTDVWNESIEEHLPY